MANDNGAKPVLSERFNRFENYVLVLGLVVLVVVLFLEDVEKIYGYPITLWGASAALRGSATDRAIPEIAQDLVGMRSLARGSGAYPILETGYKELGCQERDDPSSNSISLYRGAARLSDGPFDPLEISRKRGPE